MYDELTPPIRALYRERRDTLVSGLKSIGWDVPSPPATFYVWIPCPKGYSSTELCTKLLDEADIVTTPGIGFGESANGFIRMALTVETPRLREAVDRIGRLRL
jgi:LL-diaminopimelate aminotransferase